MEPLSPRDSALIDIAQAWVDRRHGPGDPVQEIVIRSARGENRVTVPPNPFDNGPTLCEQLRTTSDMPRKILEVLNQRPKSKSSVIAATIGYSFSRVRSWLARLVGVGFVRKHAAGGYELTDTGRAIATYF